VVKERARGIRGYGCCLEWDGEYLLCAVRYGRLLGRQHRRLVNQMFFICTRELEHFCKTQRTSMIHFIYILRASVALVEL
jgi:hypothetical protein